MKLKDLEATKIVKEVMGERDGLKDEELLASVLKKRLTKKERFAINAKVTNSPIDQTLEALNIDEKRYEEIVANVVKKIKNESLHKELYETK